MQPVGNVARRCLEEDLLGRGLASSSSTMSSYALGPFATRPPTAAPSGASSFESARASRASPSSVSLPMRSKARWSGLGDEDEEIRHTLSDPSPHGVEQRRRRFDLVEDDEDG